MRTIRPRRLFGALLPALLAAAILPLAPGATTDAQSAAIEDLSAFPHGELTVTRARRTQRFTLWIADTATRQEQGLMFVRSLPPLSGMLFPMGVPRIANFWMKNTYIPLDMLFIGPDHRIVRIAAKTVPFSLDLVSSEKPVIAVLEIAGGEAQRLGIGPGDRVEWKADAP